MHEKILKSIIIVYKDYELESAPALDRAECTGCYLNNNNIYCCFAEVCVELDIVFVKR